MLDRVPKHISEGGDLNEILYQTAPTLLWNRPPRQDHVYLYLLKRREAFDMTKFLSV